MAASNDVFISYRRDVAGYVALALQQHLTGAGIDAFYDIDSIRTGHFDSLILSQIEARPYFVLVLTPKALDRCGDPGDWLRREIEHALQTDRRIVPVHTPEFDFGDFENYLPLNTGRALARWQAIELPHRYFKYAAAELVDEYLVPIDDVSVIPTPVAHESAVQDVQQRTADAPTVTATQLSAQEHFERALPHMKAGDFDAAIAELDRAIELDPNYTRAFFNRAYSRDEKGDWDGAIADLDRAIELDPTDPDAFHNRGKARREKGDWDGAIADYGRAIELRPDDPDPFRGRGLARIGMEDWDGAIADFDRAIELSADSASAFFHRAYARDEKGDWDGAIADLDRAIELDPTDPEPFHNRGKARREKGDLDGAIADYGRAIQLDPNDAVALYNRGLARGEKGDLDGAIADFDRAIELDPSDAVAFYNRGLTRGEKGDRDGAIQDFQRGRELAPEDPDYDERLSELNHAMPILPVDHAEDCTAILPGEECEAKVGFWNQPPGHRVDEAVRELGDEAPWCLIHHRAWELDAAQPEV